MKLKQILFSTFALFALSLTTLVAQPGGGGGGGMGGGGMGGQGGGQGREGMEGQSQQSYKILEQAGYFEIDSEDIIKKIKIKKDEAKKSEIRKAVVEFTKGYEKVGQKYQKEIAAIEEIQAKIDKSGDDMTSMRNLMQGSRESVNKIRTEMVVLHKQLSEVEIPGFLDEKQLELWKKYYSTLCQTKGFVLNQPQRRQRGEGGQGNEGGQRQRPQQQ